MNKTFLNNKNKPCECCGAPESTILYELPASPTSGPENQLLLCKKCVQEIDTEERDQNHWRCLNKSMWSEIPAMQVLAWRMLHRLKPFGWPAALLEQMYLTETQLAWAKAAGDGIAQQERVVHRDVNGVVLKTGDAVVLIKDLKVKGSSMVAKQGTAVRKISLDRENANYIEGKVGGQTIVIITAYVKKV